jgi:mutator protein MutT
MLEKFATVPHKKIGVAVIYNQQGQILIDRRPAQGIFGGLWEFPGGKIEPQETVEDCIKREIFEELGLQIDVQKHIITVDHVYPHFKVSLIVHRCLYLGGEPQPVECEEIRWVRVEELEQFAFPEANTEIITALKSD